MPADQVEAQNFEAVERFHEGEAKELKLLYARSARARLVKTRARATE